VKCIPVVPTGLFTFREFVSGCRFKWNCDFRSVKLVSDQFVEDMPHLRAPRLFRWFFVSPCNKSSNSPLSQSLATIPIDRHQGIACLVDGMMCQMVDVPAPVSGVLGFARDETWLAQVGAIPSATSLI
jgi:hypothetical protein